MKLFSFIICLLIGTSSFCQSLNQLDENGKKHGTWKVYLNENWKEVKDTNAAKYIMYTNFEHGVNTNGTSDRAGLSLSSKHSAAKELLNGEYKWVNKKGEVTYIDVFENGKYISHTKYVNGMKAQFADFKMLWRNEPNTYRITLFPKKEDGKIEYYFMRNGPKGWTVYSGGEDGK